MEFNEMREFDYNPPRLHRIVERVSGSMPQLDLDEIQVFGAHDRIPVEHDLPSVHTRVERAKRRQFLMQVQAAKYIYTLDHRQKVWLMALLGCSIVFLALYLYDVGDLLAKTPRIHYRLHHFVSMGLAEIGAQFVYLLCVFGRMIFISANSYSKFLSKPLKSFHDWFLYSVVLPLAGFKFWMIILTGFVCARTHSGGPFPEPSDNSSSIANTMITSCPELLPRVSKYYEWATVNFDKQIRHYPDNEVPPEPHMPESFNHLFSYAPLELLEIILLFRFVCLFPNRFPTTSECAVFTFCSYFAGIFLHWAYVMPHSMTDSNLITEHFIYFLMFLSGYLIGFCIYKSYHEESYRTLKTVNPKLVDDYVDYAFINELICDDNGLTNPIRSIVQRVMERSSCGEAILFRSKAKQ